MSPRALHFQTYFLFPFSIDKELVKRRHREIWPSERRWLDGLDQWIAAHDQNRAEPLFKYLGGWRRDAYSNFDFDSQAYQDMVFFHPFMRRVFFDVAATAGGDDEALLRCYAMSLDTGSKLSYRAEECSGCVRQAPICDLRLFLFANGMGILSIGVEVRNIPVSEALAINESFRKVYPSSSQQVLDSRIPQRFALLFERNGAESVLLEHSFEKCRMVGMLPPLAATITGLVYFVDYAKQEYEPVLDERMVVYSYMAMDPESVPEGFKESEQYQILLSRFLYVDLQSPYYRYDPEFTRDAMKSNVYTRWAHQGTYYGFTSYSSVALTFGTARRETQPASHASVVHGNFNTRYYMMALVVLFYRATLLDFAERTAIVSKRLYLDRSQGSVDLKSVRLTDDLRAEFLRFSNHWQFTELANKDEEIEHFDMHCVQCRIPTMLTEVAGELDGLNGSLHNFYQFRNTEALNRLGMVSLILGAGAVSAGYFGMNFQVPLFSEFLLNRHPGWYWLPYLSIAVVSLVSLGSLLFGVFLVTLPNGVKILNPLTVAHVCLPAWDILEVSCIHEKNLESALFQNLEKRDPPGRRWRTELPRCWPSSAAQTWCAVFPRHAFTKTPSSATQSKESV